MPAAGRKGELVILIKFELESFFFLLSVFSLLYFELASSLINISKFEKNEDEKAINPYYSSRGASDHFM